jgi:hypothetical protein
MHIVVAFLRDLHEAVQRSTSATIDVTDPERVEAVLRDAEAALGDPKTVILATLGKPVVSDRSRAFYLRVRRRPPWGDEVFEAAPCDEDGVVEYEGPIGWQLYRCGDILPRDHWRIGAGDGDIYFVESLAPTIPPVVG